MSDFNKKLFDEKIGKDGMDSYDNDLKFMGAHEICKMVQHGQLQSSMTEMDKFILALFKQLKPDNTSDVKGNAVTCISRICSKLTEQQIEKVVTQLIEYITNDTKEYEDIRDVFVMCMKNIIQEVPHDFHEKLSVVLTQADQGIKKAQLSKKHKIEQELVEIVTLMFRKWGNIYRDTKYKGLIQQLKSNIISPGIDENLRKKSCISLGAVSVMLDTQEVSQLVNDLISAHNKITNPNTQQSQLKGIASALNSLTKTVGQKMEGQVSDLINLLKQQYKQWQLQEDAEDFDFVSIVCELYECYLNIIENLLKACSRKCFTQTMKDEIIQITQDLLTMDPNRSCNIQDMEEEFNDDDEDGMEEESDDDYLDSDVDQDDQSWRVRKSVLHLVEQLILMDKQTLNQVYHSFLAPSLPSRKNIIKRLVERNEGVRQTIINVLTTFINQIMVNETNITSHSQQQNQYQVDFEDEFGDDLQLKRITSKLVSFDILDVITPIIKEIKNIYHDKKSNTHIKISAFKLIDNLSSSAGKQILENKEAWIQMYDIEKDILQDPKSDTEIKILILSSLKKIVKYRQQGDLNYLKNNLLELLKIINKLLQNKQFKIRAYSFKLFSALLRIINQCFAKDVDIYKNEIQQIIPLVIGDLNQTDIDQEIKHTVISCANNLFNNALNLLSQDQINNILESLSKKLKSENKNRILILKLLRRLPLEIKAKLNDRAYQIMNQILDICSTFLKKEDRSDRISSLEAINALLKIQDKQCDKNLLKIIVEQSIQMIEPRSARDLDPSQADLVLQIYQQILCIDDSNNDYYKQILKGCFFLTTTNIFQSNRYESLYKVFSKLAEIKVIDSDKIITQLINESQTQTITASSNAISALIQVSQNQNALIQKIADIALNPHKDEKQIPQRQCCLQSLCEIGKVVNLTSNKQIFERVLALINNQNESLDQIRKYASIAFGGISVQNLEDSLPKVIEFINQKKNPYLMLNTLKEIIQNSNQINEKQLASIIDFLFSQACQTNDAKESDIRNIVSGCIGKLGVHNLSYLKQRLSQGLKSDNENLRYNCASSFKFFFTKDVLKNNEVQVIDELTVLLMDCISDNSNQVKEAIVKSLNSIAFNLPFIIENKVKKDFFHKMTPCFQHFDVQETDLGAFKDKRDKGAVLRGAAFQFLQSALHFKYSQDFSDEILQVCIGDMKKESENDIKLLRAQILLGLTKSNSHVVTPHCLKIKDAMVDIMKVFVGSKPIPESSLEMVKTCCAVLDQVDKQMDQKNTDYQNFLSKLKAQDKGKFGEIFETVQDW